MNSAEAEDKKKMVKPILSATPDSPPDSDEEDVAISERNGHLKKEEPKALDLSKPVTIKDLINKSCLEQEFRAPSPGPQVKVSDSLIETGLALKKRQDAYIREFKPIPNSEKPKCTADALSKKEEEHILANGVTFKAHGEGLTKTYQALYQVRQGHLPSFKQTNPPGICKTIKQANQEATNSIKGYLALTDDEKFTTVAEDVKKNISKIDAPRTDESEPSPKADEPKADVKPEAEKAQEDIKKDVNLQAIGLAQVEADQLRPQNRSRSASRNRYPYRTNYPIANATVYQEGDNTSYQRRKDFRYLCPLIGVKNYICTINLVVSAKLDARLKGEQVRVQLLNLYTHYKLAPPITKECNWKEESSHYAAIIRNWMSIRDIINKDYNFGDDGRKGDQRFERLVAALEFLSNLIIDPSLLEQVQDCQCTSFNDTYLTVTGRASSFTDSILDRLHFCEGSTEVLFTFLGTRSRLAASDI